MVDDVDTEHAGAREQLRQPRGAFAGAAPGVEDGDVVRESVAPEQRDFLRPDGVGLSLEVAHHRLVGHLTSLGIEIGHFERTGSTAAPGITPSSSGRDAFARTGAKRASSVYTTGTMTRVSTIENRSPPTTARPSGLRESAPAPSPSAIGSTPRIVVSVVIRIGRKRIREA